MALRIGIDVACRASHRGACADATGQLVWRNVRFQTRAEDLDDLWQRIPEGETDITVVMEPTRKAWVPCDNRAAMSGSPWSRPGSPIASVA